MRKIYFKPLIALLLMAPGISNAQTYFSENFDGAFTGSPAAPSGWTQQRFNYFGDGTPAALLSDGAKDWAQNTFAASAWATQNTGAGNVPTAGPLSGNAALWMQDYNFLSNYGVRRISTPTINLSTSTIPFVQFYYLYYGGSAGTITNIDLRILASNDGGSTYTSIGVIPSTGSSTGWERIAFEVPAAYKVSNAKFAIEWTGIYSFGNAFIDDFSVLEKPAGNTITADVAGGVWDATATWVGGVVPTAVDDVIIPAGTTVTVSRATANRLITCQNLTVNGTLNHSSGNHFVLAFGNVTVNTGGTLNLFNGTTGKRLHLFGNFANAGTVDASIGANLFVFMGGKPASFTNTGTFTSGKINNVWHMNGGGVTYNSPIIIQGVCGLYNGVVNPNGNLTLGVAPNANTIERTVFGSFASAPTWTNNLPSRNVSYITTTFQPFSQSVINTGEEIRGDSSGRTVTGTLAISTQDHVTLSYPLSVGNATGGALTLTRGILQTTSTNLLTLSPFISGPTGTAPSTASPPTTHGSYIVGPVRINFPSTGTTTRNFALGRGLNYNGGLTPTNNVLKTLAVANSAAWGGQTLTASIEGAASGTVNAPLTTLVNGISYRLNLNGGADLPATAWVTLLGNNYTHGGGTNSDNLIGDLGQLHIAQSTSQSGTWSTRSIPSGSGAPANNTNITRSTATGAPGPIGPLATNGEYFAFASSISTLDMGATALATPATTGCYTSTEQVKVTIRNYGSATINFAVNPVTVNTAVTGAATANLTATVNTGTLAANATLDVTMTGTLDMTATGTYTFNASTTLAGDASATNDAMTAATRINAAPVTLPQTIDFTGFTGTNLTTLFPNWYEATGATQPTGTTSNWLNRTGVIGGPSNVTAAVNLFSNTKQDWIVGPKFTATANTQLKFDVAVTDWNASGADIMGSDDKVQVMVSTDCGGTWTAVKTFTVADNLTNTLTAQTVNLGSYNGQSLIIAFLALEGPINDAEDYDFHVDNVQIAEGSSIDMGATALVAPATTGCLTSTENVTITIRNYGVSTINFVTNPVIVTTNVTGAVTNTLTKTVNTGTLAAGATLNVTMDGTLDMTATGTYTFNANTSVTGDGDAMNNNMTAATRTVVATVATPLSENFDAGTTLPSGWSTVNTWTIGSSHARGGSGNGIYYNIYGSATTATLQLPKAGLISSGDYFNFAYRIIDFTSYPATATSNASSWGNIQIQVSTNCGSSYTTLATINNMNHVSTTNWAAKAYSLSAYNGQAVIIRIVATFGAGDWYIDLDDISISNTPLPVTLTNLRGERKNDINLLSWTTVSEQNNAGFQVERSADGTNFSSLGFVSSKANGGNSTSTINYEFTDSRALNSNNYYRLKQVDKDGKATYSNVVLVKGQRVKNLELTAVYPNPTISKINIVIAAPANDRVTVMVTDLSGKLVKQQAMQVIAGDNNVQIDVQNLANGTYIIKAVCANGCETAVSKFVKQ